jgi:hypothetical protein
VEVIAEGASGEQIPTLTVNSSPNLNTYPQQPNRDTDTSHPMQVGKLKQKIVFIPTASGKMTIPAIKVHWWNSQTQHEEVAILNERKVTVLPALTKSIANSPATSQMNNIQQAATHQLKTNEQADTKGKENGYFWPIIAIIFIFIWIVTVLLWHRQIKSHRQSKGDKTKCSLKELTKLLKEACSRCDADLARESFLKWAVTYWKEYPIHSLADVIHLLEQEKAQTLSDQIMQLEAIFYGKGEDHWQGMSFWHALNDYMISKEINHTDADQDPLPPLYCSGTTS